MSPHVKKRMKSSTHMPTHMVVPTRTMSGHVISIVEGEQVRVVAKQLGRARVDTRPGQVAKNVEETSDDELFPNDIRLARERDEVSTTPRRRDTDEGKFSTLPPIPPKEPVNISKPDQKPQPHEEGYSELPMPYHLTLALVLYLYYSLNVFPYLSGLFAGFLMLYVFLGAVFVYYVNAIDKEKEERQQERTRAVLVSDDFVQTMKVDFESIKEYKVSL